MNRNKSILGIHIDDDFLNIVHLGQTKNGLLVHNCSAEPLQAGVVKNGLIIDKQAVSQKISNFINTSQVKPHKAVMSLPCSTVRLKPSEFTAETDEQLQKQVEDQIRKYALFGNEEIIFDYCIFEGAAQPSSKQTVLQAVTTRQISDACLAVARGVRLDLVRIEPAVLPIIKLDFNKLSVASDMVSLLLALDITSADLCVFKDGLPQFCQNLSIGIKDILQEGDGFSGLKDQMKPVLEFARSLTDSQQLRLGVTASCISNKLEALVDQIRQGLSDVTVEQINQSQIAEQFNVQGTDGTTVPFFAFASALTALGVCEFAGQLNLVSQDSLARQKTQKEMSLTAKVIVAIVLLSVAAIYPLKMKTRSIEAASAGIETDISETTPMQEKIADLEEQIKQLKEKQLAYVAAGQELTDIPWAQALRAIGDAVPDAVRIVGISTAASADFTLVGEALAETDVYTFVRKLQNAKLIDSAKVEEIEYDNSNAKTIVDYKIICKVRLPESNL